MNYDTTHVENIDRIRTAYIMWRDIPLAAITEEYSSLSGESSWVIKPIWSNWDKAKELGIPGWISGIDMDLRKDEYVRRYTPYFVTQRVISDKRPEVREVLDKLNLPGYDIFEILCRTHGVCGDDDYYVSRTPDLVIDVMDKNFPYDIPANNDVLRDYGWLQR